MTRYLVTGAAGFIGSQLVRALLEEKQEVHVLVRETSDLWRLHDIQESLHIHTSDISDAQAMQDLLTQIQPTHVYHLAHYGGNVNESNPKTIRETVIEGTASLYTACAALQNLQAIIHGGSSSEYGRKSEAMKEDMLAEPNTEYGLAKLWATLYGEHLRRDRGMPITTLRLFSVYGPYEARKRLFPAVILSLLKGKDPQLNNPNVARDFVYIDDVVQAFLLAREKPYGVYNIGTGTSTTIREVVDSITKHLPPTNPLVWGGEKGREFDTQFWCADMNHTKNVFGWTPQTTISEGVEKTVTWFRLHEKKYD